MKNSFKAEELKVYFICGTQDFKSANNPPTAALTCIETALKAGITMFQFREKGHGSLTGEAKLDFAKQAQALCKEYKVPFIMNDDMDLAEALDVDGVHIGQDDDPIEDVRRRFPHKIIGLSIHSPEEYAASRVDLADYIGIGPIYGTQSKDDAKAPIGLDGVEELRKVAGSLPIVAIGGITVDNAADIVKSGADGVSVISAITQAADVTEAVRKLKL